MSKRSVHEMSPEEVTATVERASLQGRKFVTVKRTSGCCKYAAIITPRADAGEILGLGSIHGFEIENLLVTHQGRQESVENDEEGQKFSSILVGGYCGILPSSHYTVRIEDVPVPWLDVGERLHNAMMESGLSGPQFLKIMGSVLAEHQLGHALLSKLRAVMAAGSTESDLSDLLTRLQDMAADRDRQRTSTPPGAEIDFGAFRINVPTHKSGSSN